MKVAGIGFVGEAGVGGDNGATAVNVGVDSKSSVALFNPLQNRFQGMVLLAFAEGLGVDDDLVLLSTVATPL